MEEPKNKYILVHDRVGYTLERNLLAFGLFTKSTPTQVLQGELLEPLPEGEQPLDYNRIALVGIDRKSLRLECRMEDLTRLSDEEANLLLGISNAGLRYETFVDGKRLDFGRQLLPGDQVFVTLKGISSKEIPGIAWYKGELPSNLGTMFGVELIVSSYCYLMRLLKVFIIGYNLSSKKIVRLIHVQSDLYRPLSKRVENWLESERALSCGIVRGAHKFEKKYTSPPPPAQMIPY